MNCSVVSLLFSTRVFYSGDLHLIVNELNGLLWDSCLAFLLSMKCHCFPTVMLSVVSNQIRSIIVTSCVVNWLGLSCPCKNASLRVVVQDRF